MSLLLLWGGASVGSTPGLAFNDIPVILLPDEVAIGQEFSFYAQIIQDTGPQTLSEAAQYTIYGFDANGVRSAVVATTPMTEVGTSNLWKGTWTPSAAGVYQLVVAMNHTSVHALSMPITVRSKFDPIGLAVDDVMVSRMGNEDVLGTA